MAEKANMRCPVCGAQMNHHADKLIASAEADRAAPVIEEFHHCPKCGANATRRGSDY